MNTFKQHVAAKIAELAGLETSEAESWLEYPPDPTMGDFAFPCFRLARSLRKAPPAIARDIAEGLKPDGIIDSVTVAKAYVNVSLRGELLAERVLKKLFADRNDFGRRALEGKTFVMDYSSPNVAKSFHFGHLRSTMIGHSLKRILQHLGHRVVGINHLGDWGTQFGIVVAAFRRWGEEEKLAEARKRSEGNRYLQTLYVKGTAEAESDEAFRAETRKAFRDLEEGDPDVVAMWKRFLEIGMEEFRGFYERLGVTFDHYQGESFYNDKMDAVIELLEEKGLLQQSEGASIVDLSDDDMPPCLIRKGDGATLYATRDLAAALYRRKTWNPDAILYIHGAPQKLHFRQWFRVLEKCDDWWKGRLHHLDFGHYRFKDSSMSTRKGKVIFLSEVIDEGVAHVERKIAETEAERGEALPDRQAIVEAVALGGIVFGDLATDRVKDVVFDWDRILDFQGDTGPYVQYTHARMRNILRKAGYEPSSSVDFRLLTHGEERNLLLRMLRFHEVLAAAEESFKPSLLANYLLEVAKGLNRYYHGIDKIIHTEIELRKARLLVIDCACSFLALGLHLLGIEAPERM